MSKDKILAFLKANRKEVGLAAVILLMSTVIVVSGATVNKQADIKMLDVRGATADTSLLDIQPDPASLPALQPTEAVAENGQLADLVAAATTPDSDQAPAETPAPVAEEVKPPEKLPVVAKPTPKTIAKATVDKSGLNCVKLPASINAMLRAKNSGSAPDGKGYKGKMVCHNIADGKKDKPHKSSEKNKGKKHNGGLCLDPDERPMPTDGNVCYPEAIYGDMLRKYAANPW